MLKMVKSIIILKKIFFLLKDKNKFNLVVYNKSLQKKLGLNITDFKRYSGRYILLENGQGKEYNGYNDKLLFEGEYIKGKRNGKGKEYNINRKLRFEGEYKNGKRNGKGKEYDFNGNLKFEGEYLNGVKNGKGKEYNYNGTLKFEGKYYNGEMIKNIHI